MSIAIKFNENGSTPVLVTCDTAAEAIALLQDYWTPPPEPEPRNEFEDTAHYLPEWMNRWVWTLKERWEFLNNQAQRDLGMSWEQFQKQWEDDSFPIEVIASDQFRRYSQSLALLIPLAQQTRYMEKRLKDKNADDPDQSK